MSCRKIVVLGSVEAAQALLESRGADYSGRPKFTVFEIMGWVPTITLLQYGKRYLKHRKMLQQYFGPRESLSFSHIIAEEARLLVKNLSSGARGTHRHFVQRYTVSNIMRAAFGHQIKTDDDEFLKLGNDLSHSNNSSGPPGNTPVDFFPWCKPDTSPIYLEQSLIGLCYGSVRFMPSWFPGTHYASVARSHYKTVRKLYDFPLEFVQARMVRDRVAILAMALFLNINARPYQKNENYEKCFASQQLEGLDENADPEHLEDIKATAAAIFSGGEDT
ncbi:hypothetical protein V5O48_011728, partial [Marasmius crinis-equi]